MYGEPQAFKVYHVYTKNNIYILYIDGRKAVVVKDQLTELYKQFLSDYAHNMMAEYVTDINDDSIKVILLASTWLNFIHVLYTQLRYIFMQNFYFIYSFHRTLL